MTRSEAYTYSEIFRCLDEPDALLVLDAVYDADGEISVTDIADNLNISARTVESICNQLEAENVLDEINRGGAVYFKFASTNQGKTIYKMFERLFRY